MDFTYSSIHEIYDDLLEIGYMSNLKFERCVKYASDFMHKVGSVKIYEDHDVVLPINNHIVDLPCDFYRIKQCEYNGVSLRYSTSSYDVRKDESVDETYIIKGKTLHTSIREGKLRVSYQSVPVDEDGFPLVINDPSYKQALELYIQLKHVFPLVAEGKFRPDAYSVLKQDYAFNVGQATSRLEMMSVDEAESFFNMWSTLVPRKNEHKYGFRNTGSKEFIVNHPNER